MNWQLIRTLIEKDLRVVFRSRAVTLPLILLPVILLVILPAIGGSLLATVDPESPAFIDTLEDLGPFMDNLPQSLEQDTYDNDVQRVVYLLFGVLFLPLFLLVPIMATSVIAADSFVGERERKTLEALVYTPTTDHELYIAKILAPWLVALAVAWLGFIAYALVLNITLGGMMGGIFFPNILWVLLMVWVVPPVAGIGLGVVVLISSRVNTFQEAYQISGVIVLPVILLLFGQLGGVLYFEPVVIFALGAILWVMSGFIIGHGATRFRRGELIARI
jgi:ABC-2 type transport system permease protein